jgi:hypothetical protein
MILLNAQRVKEEIPSKIRNQYKINWTKNVTVVITMVREKLLVIKCVLKI